MVLSTQLRHRTGIMSTSPFSLFTLPVRQNSVRLWLGGACPSLRADSSCTQCSSSQHSSAAATSCSDTPSISATAPPGNATGLEHLSRIRTPTALPDRTATRNGGRTTGRRRPLRRDGYGSPTLGASGSFSPAKASTLRRIAVDIHMPAPSNRSTWVTTRSIKPRDFASTRTLNVPQTSRPAACAIRRACPSSSRTVHSACSSAKASTASSPAPRSTFSH